MYWSELGDEVLYLSSMVNFFLSVSILLVHGI